MPPENPISAIAHVIQLAVAPVFLVSGVATFLNVLANRLGRIVDRARFLECKLEAPDQSGSLQMNEEMSRLHRRGRLINFAICCGTTSALLTCITISTLFTGTFVPAHLSRVITALFVAAMFTLFLSLSAFLREVIIATRALRISARPQGQGATPAKTAPPLVQE